MGPVVLARSGVPVLELKGDGLVVAVAIGRVIPLMAMLLSSLPLRVALMLSVMVRGRQRMSTHWGGALASMGPVASSVVSPPLPTDR